MKRLVTPALAVGICSLAIALPRPQDGASPLMLVGSQRSPGHVLDLSLGPVLPVQANRSGAGGAGGSYQASCPCPTGARAEVEPNCGLNPDGSADASSDTVNGGCNSIPEVFDPIKLGDVICGTTAWDVNGMGFGDEDWFETVLTTETAVTFEVRGDFASVAVIVDGTLGCAGLVTLGSDVGSGCDDPATVSATLPPGTYWFIAKPDSPQPPVPCGTTYTATLTGACEFYSSEAVFDAAFPGLTLEDFEGTGVPPGSVCGDAAPWDSTTANVCIVPGDIEAGLSLDSVPSSGTMLIVGIGYSGGIDSDSVWGSDGDTELTFTPAVRHVGLDMEGLITIGPLAADISVFGAGGVPIGSTSVLVDDESGSQTFLGLACDEPIESIVVSGVASGQDFAIDNVRFGGTGGCEFITNEAQFDTRFPNLALEDFEDTAIAPATQCVDAGPWDSTTANACISPGEIEAGLSIDDDGSALGVALVGIGYACGGPVDSNSVSGIPDTGLTFDPAVSRIGLDLETSCTSGTSVLIEVFGPGAVSIGSTTVAVTDVQSFLGIACDGLIERVEIRDTSGGEAIFVDNIRYGTGCTLIEDADDFDSLYPDLGFEDFEDFAVGVNSFCLDAGPWDATTLNSCIAPGDIEPGIAFENATGPTDNLFVFGEFFVGSNTNTVFGEGADRDTVVRFSPPVRQLGLTLEILVNETALGTIDLFGVGGEMISSSVVTLGLSKTFFGFSCDQPIARMHVSGSDVEALDDIRFGTSKLPFTRFCVEESVASVNTGLKTKMILESQDAGGGLLPFNKSLAGNAAPNRFMMIAKDAPGLGNGGVTNIGYFIMGTGANTFVPPGSAGPICVAPGIRRYIGPVNMTSETITFHDAAGTPTTLVGQGFSRAPLGAGAHFIGTNLGGTLGYHWSFQAWHRDTPGDANLSDAIAVDFTP